MAPSSSRRGPKPKPNAAEPSHQESTKRVLSSKNVTTKKIARTPLPLSRTTEREKTKQPLKNFKNSHNESNKKKTHIPPISEYEEKRTKQRRFDYNATPSSSNRNDERKKKNEITTVYENAASFPSNDVAREKVRKLLKLFHGMRRLFSILSPFETAKTLKDRGKFLNDRKVFIGKVPGVEVGDVFQYWNELNIIGLHREMKYEKYIDHVIRDRKRIATSVVYDGLDDDRLEHNEVYISTELRENAELLVNSFNVKNDIRVIIKCFLKNSGRCGMDVYCYYGLYKVKRCGRERMVYTFCLVRNSGQEEVAWNVLMKYGIDGIRKGLIVEDISRQREAVPICVINTVDKERLTVESFVYKTKMIYPNWCKPIPVPHLGCDCEGKCGDSAKCLCAVRNGGKIPYNKNNVIVASGGVIHECGPYCKCSADCPNRVSQKGIKFNLEIFRTERKGWGVRSRDTIPAGSFICEYIGEVIEDDEVDKRVDNDEYLFSIDDYHMDMDDSVLKEASNMINDDEDEDEDEDEDGGDEEVLVDESGNENNGGFTIDAAYYGNVARFINHSCSPNLFGQNVLYDHDDGRIPHIMLFSAETIPKMTELTYHYHYKIGLVLDGNGNVKTKNCYCGAFECGGRLY